MARGGKRPGAGRKPGSQNKFKRINVEEALKQCELPHVFLLRVANGAKVGGKKPSMAHRIEAARAAAPYFAVKAGHNGLMPPGDGEKPSLSQLEAARRVAYLLKVGVDEVRRQEAEKAPRLPAPIEGEVMREEGGG